MQSLLFSRIIILLKGALYPIFPAAEAEKDVFPGTKTSVTERQHTVPQSRRLTAGSAQKGKLNMKRKASASVLSMVQLALFSAIILAMAFTPGLGYIPLGVTRATIIHLPVIIGAILLGPKKGAFLGGVFGLTSLINNTINPTITSFTFSPFYSGGNLWSLVICFIPRILIGVVSYYVYKGLCRLWKMAGKEKNNFFDAFSLGAAGLLGSMTNTVLVMSLIYVCFGKSYAAAKGIGFETLYSVILGVVAINGVLEALVAAAITAVVCKVLLRVLKKQAG